MMATLTTGLAAAARGPQGSAAVNCAVFRFARFAAGNATAAATGGGGGAGAAPGIPPKVQRDGSYLRTPTAPPGTPRHLYRPNVPAPFLVPFYRYAVFLTVGTLGLFQGAWFYRSVVMQKNPPNPTRLLTEVPPSKHPHAPEEEED